MAVPELRFERRRGPPTYAGGYVYTATSDGRVYQFDAATGERLWTYNEFYNVGGITVVDDVAYVAGTYYQHSGYGGTLHALNASTRKFCGPSIGRVPPTEWRSSPPSSTARSTLRATTATPTHWTPKRV